MLETCLYVRRMDLAVKFYKDILGLQNFMVTVWLLRDSIAVSKTDKAYPGSSISFQYWDNDATTIPLGLYFQRREFFRDTRQRADCGPWSRSKHCQRAGSQKRNAHSHSCHGSPRSLVKATLCTCGRKEGRRICVGGVFGEEQCAHSLHYGMGSRGKERILLRSRWPCR